MAAVSQTTEMSVDENLLLLSPPPTLLRVRVPLLLVLLLVLVLISKCEPGFTRGSTVYKQTNAEVIQTFAR